MIIINDAFEKPLDYFPDEILDAWLV